MPIRGKESTEALVYAACAVDCEGSITLMRHVSRKGYHSSGIFVSIANVNRQFIDFFRATFGGSVLEESPKKLSKQLIYRWKIYGYAASEFLAQIRPYLLIKFKQADLAMWFVRTKKDLTYAQRDDAWREMKQLNNGSKPPAETKRVEAGSNLLSDSPTLSEGEITRGMTDSSLELATLQN